MASTYRYEYFSTEVGEFNDTPDQVAFFGGNDDILYICEDGDFKAGLFGRMMSNGKYFAIVKAIQDTEGGEETTGIASSPDLLHMYFAYYNTGILYDCTRDDGLGFNDPYDIVFI